MKGPGNVISSSLPWPVGWHVPRGQSWLGPPTSVHMWMGPFTISSANFSSIETLVLAEKQNFELPASLADRKAAHSQQHTGSVVTFVCVWSCPTLCQSCTETPPFLVPTACDDYLMFILRGLRGNALGCL